MLPHDSHATRCAIPFESLPHDYDLVLEAQLVTRVSHDAHHGSGELAATLGMFLLGHTSEEKPPATRPNGAAKLRFVGFDASDKLVEAVRKGSIDGLVLQDPFQMGYLAVRTAVEHVRGKNVAPRTDTGAKLVHRDNLGQPEIQALIKPDLAKWLDGN